MARLPGNKHLGSPVLLYHNIHIKQILSGELAVPDGKPLPAEARKLLSQKTKSKELDSGITAWEAPAKIDSSMIQAVAESGPTLIITPTTTKHDFFKAMLSFKGTQELDEDFHQAQNKFPAKAVVFVGKYVTV